MRPLPSLTLLDSDDAIASNTFKASSTEAPCSSSSLCEPKRSREPFVLTGSDDNDISTSISQQPGEDSKEDFARMTKRLLKVKRKSAFAPRKN